jgi:3-phosphoshikimate 1-carboxyvinyltransferase
MNAPSSPWLAPTANNPVIGEVRIPGSKSQTNRAYILAALANSESVIESALVARDTNLMLSAIEKLGAKISHSDEKIFIEPGLTSESDVTIDVGLAGTVMRFVPPLAALSHSKVLFDGDEQARIRPMSVMLEALKQLGVAVQDPNKGHLPFVITGRGHVSGSEITIDASSSSQFVSGLLLAAPRFDLGLTIHHVGNSLPSFPHIDMTMQMLSQIGIACEYQVSDNNHHTWIIKPALMAGNHWKIEPDLSNAAPFLAAAMATEGSVTIKDWPKSTTQAGGYLPEILKKMGAQYILTDQALTLMGPKKIKPLEINLKEVGELTPAIAALMALADGESEISGIAHLRGHETDRLAALAFDLSQVGVSTEVFEDGIRIIPKNLHAGKWKSFADHRMATAGAIIGLRVAGVEVDDITCTSKTMNNFEDLWKNLLTA